MGFGEAPTEARGKDSKGDNYDTPNAQRIHTPRVLPKQTANGSADERGTSVKMLDKYVRTVACQYVAQYPSATTGYHTDEKEKHNVLTKANGVRYANAVDGENCKPQGIRNKEGGFVKLVILGKKLLHPWQKD